MRAVSLHFLLLLLPSVLCAQQALVVERTTVIPLGPGASQVGVEKAEGENWKPLFFSVDAVGNIHIPDFYKGRIAVYGTDGALVHTVPVQEGISPRMNFFSLAAVPGYVTWDGGTLFLLDEKGGLRWKHVFGYGVIPDRVYASPSGVFVHLPAVGGKDQGCLVFGYSSATILGTFGLSRPEGRVPLIAATGGRPFALKLGDMRLLPDFANDTFAGPSGLTLLSVADDFRSAWFEHAKNSDVIHVFSASGKLLRSGTIIFPAGEEGTGFWTCADADLAIYKNFFVGDSLQVVKYSFPR